MGSLGFPELMVILVIALIVFGPRKLPELGKALGQTMNEFKKGATGLRNTFEDEVRRDEQQKQQTIAAQTTPPAGSDTKTA
jgi:sec-independent protein translocase protein TatA